MTAAQTTPFPTAAPARRTAPALALLAWLRARIARITTGARDRGASALEFAIIAAVVVVAASVIGAVIFNIVQDKSTELQECANQPIGADACAQ